MKLLLLPCIFMAFSGILGIPLNDVDLELDAENGTTVIPATIVTATVETTTIKPITIEPITMSSEGPSPASIVPISSNAPPSGSTQSTPKSSSSPMTTPNNTPSPPEKETGFDGASFGGGIGTGVGIFLILFAAWKCYVMKRQGKGYSTM